MSKRPVSVAMMTLLLIGTLSSVLYTGFVKAIGTIYIHADGSIDPSWAPIETFDYVTYTLTDNIASATNGIVVERANIIIDGNGYTLQGPGIGNGFHWAGINNVTVKNTNIKGFNVGITFSSSFNTILGNNITDNTRGFYLWLASNNIVLKNNVANNTYYGVILDWGSSDNLICHNNFINNPQQVYIVYSGFTNSWDNGYPGCGNYWSNYRGTDFYGGPFQNETGSDGVGDTPYVFDRNNADNYPLMNPWTPSFTILNRMVVASISAPPTLDPARAYDTASMELIRNVYETLVFFDEEKVDQFVPRLATDWTVSGDGLNYTFTIRQGVLFHNNDTLTTVDIEYSLERLLVIEGDPAWMFYEAFFNQTGSSNITGQQIDNAITRTATTVTLHLVKPYPPFLQILSQPWSSILSKSWAIEIGDWPQTWNNWTSYNKPTTTAIEAQNHEPPGPHMNAMCGTGPFILDYYQTGVEWSIIKFGGYWGGWPAPGSYGFLQRITSKKITDWETLKRMFLEGELDSIQVPRANTGEVLGQPGVRSYYPLQELVCQAMFYTFNISVSSPYLGVPGGLPKGTFNQSGIPPDFFTDINVRKGFAYAFNYTKLIQEELLGEASQPATPIIPGVPFHNPAQEKYSISLTRAQEHFGAAWGGSLWANGFNFTIAYNQENLIRKKAAQIIKANVESLNDKFHIQIKAITYASFLTRGRNHELPLFLIGWLADYADPHNFAYAFMHRDGIFPQWQRYSNSTIDTLVTDGFATLNETARREIYYELQRLYHEDVSSVPLYQTLTRRFERDWVQGWYYNPLLYNTNYFYVQWKGSMPPSTQYGWPMFHHNLRHTGYTESPAPNTNQTEWVYGTEGGVYSSPAVADGKVYVGSDDGKIYCLDAATGMRIWNYTTGNGNYTMGNRVHSSPAVADGRVFVGSDDYNVYCLDAATGTHIWTYPTGGCVSSSPAVADGRVYVGSRDGNVYCLSATTGALLWNYTAGVEVCSSPAVAEGKVYAGSAEMDYGDVYCLDAATGTNIWSFRTGGGVDSSPAVVDGKVYVGSSDDKVYCLDAYTGALIWSYRTGDMVGSSPAVANGKVYVGSYNGKVHCLNALTGTSIWNYTTGDWVYSSPAVADGKVYVGSYDSKVYCLDATTGNPVWNYATGGCVDSSPAVADGMVFVGSNDSRIYAFGNIIRVPQDYPTVQKAVDAAPENATIIIEPGFYNESIVINKTLTIIGKKGSDTTFTGGGSGIAITITNTVQVTITQVVITYYSQGILIDNSMSCRIYNNVMYYMGDSGINLKGENADNNLIYSNTFSGNYIGINLTATSTGNLIYANTIRENYIGINMLHSSGNTIYWNSFEYNTLRNVNLLNPSSNVWDMGYPDGGNYWSNYAGVDANGDGIGDTPYVINTDNIDYYPLMSPYTYWINPMIGDVNRNMRVDFADLRMLAAAYGSTLNTPNWNSRCDFNTDLKVEVVDLFKLGKNFGKTP